MSETILGAIVGAAAALLGAIITGIMAELIKSSLDIKNRNREQLLEGCEAAKELLIRILKNPSLVQDELVIKTKVKLSIYAPKEIGAAYDEIINCIYQSIQNKTPLIGIDDKIEKFNELIKKELKIER